VNLHTSQTVLEKIVFSLKFLLLERLLLISKYQVNAGLLNLDTNRKNYNFAVPEILFLENIN
jgi:hypothetical protein